MLLRFALLVVISGKRMTAVFGRQCCSVSPYCLTAANTCSSVISLNAATFCHAACRCRFTDGSCVLVRGMCSAVRRLPHSCHQLSRPIVSQATLPLTGTQVRCKKLQHIPSKCILHVTSFVYDSASRAIKISIIMQCILRPF